LATAQSLRRDLSITDDDEFVIAPASPARGSGLTQIFSGALVWITPLLWVCFASALMTNFFLRNAHRHEASPAATLSARRHSNARRPDRVRQHRVVTPQEIRPPVSR
jgi:hypothetical protein